MAGKRIELLRELTPGLKRLGILTEVGNPYAALDVKEVQGAARTFNIQVQTVELRPSDEIDVALNSLKGHVQALYVLPIPRFFANRAELNTGSVAAGLPTMYVIREYVQAGGLSPWSELAQHAASRGGPSRQGPEWRQAWRHSD